MIRTAYATWLAIKSFTVVPRLSKFAVVGASGIGINMASFWLLTSVLHLHYLPSGVLAIETAMCSNYVLNNNWTFADRRTARFSLSGLVRYHTVSYGGMIINLAVLHLLAGLLGVYPMLANVAGIGAASVWNFCLHLRWTWRRRAQRAAPGGMRRTNLPAEGEP
jgi:dolichol-phosphate mannosyltransferase